MRLFVSIVSHLHHSILINLGTMRLLAEHPDIVVVCRDNVSTQPLKIACKKYQVHYQCNSSPMGFSANNNANFEYCRTHLGMADNDYFIVFNPDLFMQKRQIDAMVLFVKRLNKAFLVPNLLLDNEELMVDDNIRRYPSFFNFIQTYVFNKRVTVVNRSKGLKDTQNYWASGAFLIVKTHIYQSVRGLDERYYMYCEDIDFCARLKKQGVYFHYLPKVKATHLRRRDSKRFLSKYFWWHVASVFRYSFLPRRVEAKKSRLQAGNSLASFDQENVKNHV